MENTNLNFLFFPIFKFLECRIQIYFRFLIRRRFEYRFFDSMRIGNFYSSNAETEDAIFFDFQLLRVENTNLNFLIRFPNHGNGKCEFKLFDF